MNKRKLIKQMTDKDVSKKIAYMELLETDDNQVENTPNRRRVSSQPVKTGRRAG